LTQFAADHAGAVVRPSPNFGERRGVSGPDMLVLHYTGMQTGQGAEDWLCNIASEVSSHYLVHEDGRVVQMVREADRAWHAGKSSWHGETDLNSRSVGMEIVNPGHQWGYVDFPDAQIEAVIALCRGIIARHGIEPQRVLAHSDIAPGRKVDPGELFPWQRLHAAGVGHWVAPSPIDDARAATIAGSDVLSVQEMLAAYGYGVEPSGEADPLTSTVIAAFQRHFRPARVDGIADASTVDTLSRLLAGLPRTV